MANPIILPDNSTVVDWGDVRKGLKACIQAVAPTARVYSRWPLKYDIGQTINLLASSKDNKRVHAWIIGISRAEPYSDKIGGYALQWELNVRIWGFVGYVDGADDNSTQDILEEEARKVAQVIFLNQKHLAMNSTAGLKDVGYLIFEDIDVHGFGSGDDVHVAQGNLTIRLGEK